MYLKDEVQDLQRKVSWEGLQMSFSMMLEFKTFWYIEETVKTKTPKFSKAKFQVSHWEQRNAWLPGKSVEVQKTMWNL